MDRETLDRGRLKKQAKAVKDARFKLVAEEQRLQLETWKYLRPRGSMRATAAELGISVPYLCDIAHGRRKVSDAVVEKVLAL